MSATPRGFVVVRTLTEARSDRSASDRYTASGRRRIDLGPAPVAACRLAAMLATALLVPCLYLAGGASGDAEGAVLPSGRLSLGLGGRLGAPIGPLFNAQILGGVGFVVPTDSSLAVVVWPQIGGGLDVSPIFVSGYTILSAGVMFGNTRFGVGYHPGFIAGTDQVRGPSIVGLDRRRGMHGFHHTLEVRGPLGFWGFEAQHDIFVQPQLRHGLRVMFVLEFPIGLVMGMVADNISFGGF